MKHLSPTRIAQVALMVLTAAAIAYTFAPRQEQPDGGIIPAARRTAMPNFTMPDLRGGAWSLSEHRGRVVLVNFWATWCAPCREEIPGFVRLANSRRDLDITGIAMDEGDVGGVRQFVKAAEVTYPILLPPASSPFASAIQSLPTTFLVDKEGRIAKEYVGAVSQRAVQEDLDRLSTEP